ncbi:hypothetical protein [Halosimplex marinum]|uniref:hypothetical protein n=1 Tax=Halosimplex marinum TaxID=3396620 RepID=UPI003F54FC67
MVQGNPGFLTDSQREYLAASEEERKKMREKNPNITRRIRQSLNGAQEDWARVFESDADLFDGWDLTKERTINTIYQRKDEKVLSGVKSSIAQSKAYGSDDLVDLDGETPDELLNEMEKNQSQLRNFVAKSVVQGLTDSGEDIEGFSDEQMRRLIEIVFPEKEKVEDTIVEEFSDR